MTVGWAVNSFLLTAPDASVVTTSLVAVPNVSWIALLVDRETGLVIVAVRSLDPVRPTIDRPGKLISPSSAFLTTFPEISASVMVSSIDGLPVVTRLPSASLIRTTTSESSSVAFAALSGAITSRLVASP